MARLPIPAPDRAPEKSRALLDQVQAQLGSVPNLFRVLSTSPAALGGYMALSRHLAGGAFDLATRERIALAVAEVNGCTYCLSAHSALGKNLARMDDREIELARGGRASEPVAQAALELAVALTRDRGRVAAAELDRARAAGLTDEQIVDVIAHVALNVLTNYVNVALATDVDFPLVEARPAA